MKNEESAIAFLWAGSVPLAEAFWWYGIVLGFMVNAAATLAALGLGIAMGKNLAVMVLYLLPVPYNLLVLVGVWQSAANWDGKRTWAVLARCAIVPWTIGACLL